jgi:serine/threonine protein kinase
MEGLAILMDDHQWTLRHWIGGDIRLTQYDWLQIMFGIANNLVHAHGQAQVHGDLKPSNGTLPTTQSTHTTSFGGFRSE